MQVIHFSAECYPVAKVGGLGDVVAALPKYQCKAGIDAKVVMPWYNKPFVARHQFSIVHEATIYQGDRPLHVQIFKENDDVLGFNLYLVKIAGLLDRDNIYSYSDENEQFIGFQHAALQWINSWQVKPDIFHCHDHHTGLIPFLAKYGNDFGGLRDIATIGTVHNAQYQGWMGWEKARYLPSYDAYRWGLLDWNKNINSLASLIKCCSAYTTVSPGYLQEIFREANGLEALFSAEWGKGTGIVNGIDTDVWNTLTDPMLYENFAVKDVTAGKKTNKENLCATFGLDPALPLFSFIGRLVDDKGADLLYNVFENALFENEFRFNIIVLGSGSPELEFALNRLRETYPNRVAVFMGYNDELSHRIYAASDFLIMPSRVEPCGLNQLYALRYGTIPIVHRIGGLGDTIRDFGEVDGYGICFSEASVYSAQHAIGRAVKLFYDQKAVFNLLRKKIMELDFSWDKSAGQYNQLYNQLKP